MKKVICQSLILFDIIVKTAYLKETYICYSYYNWAVAAPMVLSMTAFQKNLPKVLFAVCYMTHSIIFGSHKLFQTLDVKAPVIHSHMMLGLILISLFCHISTERR